jgi:hypothetical protein
LLWKKKEDSDINHLTIKHQEILIRNMKKTIPLPQAYWVIPGKFLVGGYPGSKIRDLAGFFELKVSHIINLMEPNEKDQAGKTFPEYSSSLYSQAKALNTSIRISKKPIPYGGIPAKETMRWILGKLDMVINRNRLVYLHSRDGLERTGMVVGCYLVRHGKTGEEALEWINNLRVGTLNGHLPSPKTEAQRKMVLNWEGNF